MAKLLTEREAWLLLAEWWSGKLRTDDDGDTLMVGGKWGCYGLCSSIVLLSSTGRISQEIQESMRRKLGEVPGSDYRWPQTLAGARQRAAFCRRMAAELKPRKRRRTAAKAK